MVQCSKLTHGGCCPQNTICTPNGCVRIIAASVISVETTTYSSLFSVLDGSEVTKTGEATINVTERPAATTTGVKYGEVLPPSSSAGQSIFVAFCLPYTLAALLVIVALMTGFL